MFSKVFLIFGFVIFATQAYSSDHIKIEDPTLISENDVTFDEVRIPTLLEILKILRDFDFGLLSDIDREELKSFISTILELTSNSDPIQLRRCILRIVRALDRDESMKYLRVLVKDGPKLIRLNIERREGLAECELIGGEKPSLMETIAKRRCIAELEASIGTQITAVNIRLRPAVNYYRRIARDMGKCIGLTVLPSTPWLISESV